MPVEEAPNLSRALGGPRVGAGYGVPSEASIEATRLFARTEGVILDRVYTAKAASCMVARIQEGRYARDDTLIFVHIGGTPAVFTWSAVALKGYTCVYW